MYSSVHAYIFHVYMRISLPCVRMRVGVCAWLNLSHMHVQLVAQSCVLPKVLTQALNKDCFICRKKNSRLAEV